jgi:REP element-mobilizing transposase RayT
VSRPLRIEYEGAIYHVNARGNYRKDLFTVGKSAQAFEKALMQCSRRCGWRLHAYVIMSNHYHLCLETPEGNLVDGMRWLQGTFGNRFNRFTGERGHLFQGRYKALLVGEGESIVSLVNYIHLNPVRAGLLDANRLKEYKFSSYPKFFKRRLPEMLVRDEFLMQAGLGSGLSGMRAYHQYLQTREEALSSMESELQKKLCKGWVIARPENRKTLIKELAKRKDLIKQGVSDTRELRELNWEDMVVGELKSRKKDEQAIEQERKLVDWKVAIALRLRQETIASNTWIARRLNMGDP